MGQRAVDKSGPNPLFDMVRDACREAIHQELETTKIRTIRLMKIQQAAAYLALSPREIHNMIADHTFAPVKRGRAVMLDIDELDEWIEKQKDVARLWDPNVSG